MDIQPEDEPTPECDLPPMNDFMTLSASYLAIMTVAFLLFLWIVVDRLWYRFCTAKRSYRERVLYDARQQPGRKKLE